MRGTSSERLGAAFNLEVQSRRHCILHSGLSEKRPPTSFAVYHFSMTLKLAICCAIPNWCGKETTALILSFFLLIVFQDFCIQANLERLTRSAFVRITPPSLGSTSMACGPNGVQGRISSWFCYRFVAALLLRQRTYSAVQNIWLAAWNPCQ